MLPTDNLHLHATFEGSIAVDNVAIGCGHNNEGLFVGAAGIIGLGGDALSFQSHINASTISYYLVDRDSNSASTLEFSTAAPTDTVNATLVHNPRLETFYYVGWTGIRVTGDLLSILMDTFELGVDGDGVVVIDSGTTITRLTSTVYDSLHNAFKKGMGHPSTNSVALFDTCYNLSKRTSVEVLTVSFRFSDGKELVLQEKIT